MVSFSSSANAKKNYISGLEEDTILMSRNVEKQTPIVAASHLRVIDTSCKKDSSQPHSNIQANQKILAANDRILSFTAPTAVGRYLVVLEVGTKIMYVSMNKDVRNIIN
jgi:hypothetical protein